MGGRKVIPLHKEGMTLNAFFFLCCATLFRLIYISISPVTIQSQTMSVGVGLVLVAFSPAASPTPVEDKPGPIVDGMAQPGLSLSVGLYRVARVMRGEGRRSGDVLLILGPERCMHYRNNATLFHSNPQNLKYFVESAQWCSILVPGP